MKFEKVFMFFYTLSFGLIYCYDKWKIMDKTRINAPAHGPRISISRATLALIGRALGEYGDCILETTNRLNDASVFHAFIIIEKDYILCNWLEIVGSTDFGVSQWFIIWQLLCKNANPRLKQTRLGISLLFGIVTNNPKYQWLYVSGVLSLCSSS